MKEKPLSAIGGKGSKVNDSKPGVKNEPPSAVGGKGNKVSVNQVPLGQRRDPKADKSDETNRRLNEMRSRCHAAMAARQTCRPKASATTQSQPRQPDKPPPVSNRQQPPASNRRPRSEERRGRPEERVHDDHARRPRSPRRPEAHDQDRRPRHGAQNRRSRSRRDRRDSGSRSQRREPARGERRNETPHEVSAVIELARLILDRGGGRR